MRAPGWWTWAGLAAIGLSLALAPRVEFVGVNLTPLCWTGFVLAVDGLLDRRGASWLRRRPLELVLMAAISIPSWLLFEWYDRPRFWISDGPELWWHYRGLPEWPWRGLGYAWSFATITPAVLLLAQLLEPPLDRSLGRGRGGRVPAEVAALMSSVGFVLAAFPLLWPSPYFAADVWLAWPLLLDPVNRLRGRASMLGDLEHGRRGRPASLLASGLACGVLWEAWNWRATARWTYTVPFAGEWKVFEMPVLGFLGFVPFAVAMFAQYAFLRGLLPGKPPTPCAPASAG
ncbi:MAG: hypothetical protein ACOY3Y_13845 [Acidobacteriota bacterium]